MKPEKGETFINTGFYEIDNATLPAYAIFIGRICAWIYTPTDFDLGKHTFSVLI